MRILLLVQYYLPENVGPAIWVSELAAGLGNRGHEVSVISAFPNHPTGRVFPDYRGRFLQRDDDGKPVVMRTWIYATPSKSFWPRVLNFGSFCASSLVAGIAWHQKYDVVYAILPPLPLGVSGKVLASLSGARLVVNIQDIYPHAAVAMGVLKNRSAIRFFERMERWVYQHARHVVVISDGFREDLIHKGVAASKITVVPNWADPSFVLPGPKDNAFRRELKCGDRFTLVYSGGLTHNSNLEPMIDAAAMLSNEPFAFVIVGDGVRKPFLEQKAQQMRLTNVAFRPFQPLAMYPQVLLAGDANLVTLSSQAAHVSVPSKVYKQMAAGRPIIAISAPGNELERLIARSQCGICVPPDDPVALKKALEWLAENPAQADNMGQAGREYLLAHHSADSCIDAIEEAMKGALAS
jgi:colanic acid biosynthesis glycosyl transferase WcaI